jgi:hypothetical protein
MFGIVLLIAGLFWLAGNFFSHKEAQKAQS